MGIKPCDIRGCKEPALWHVQSKPKSVTQELIEPQEKAPPKRTEQHICDILIELDVCGTHSLDYDICRPNFMKQENGELWPNLRIVTKDD